MSGFANLLHAINHTFIPSPKLDQNFCNFSRIILIQSKSKLQETKPGAYEPRVACVQLLGRPPFGICPAFGQSLALYQGDQYLQGQAVEQFGQPKICWRGQ
jgi:hypothetical protein